MRVHLRLPSPLGTQVLHVDADTLAGELLPFDSAYLRTRTRLVSLDETVGSLELAPGFPIDIDVVPRTLGGKGGFGANLRAAGGRMSTAKTDNTDSCRDLNGRRLGSIKEAQKQAEMIESLPALRAKAAAENTAKLEALERKLGVSSGGSGGDGVKRLAEVDLAELARKKHKFEDDKFIEETREIKDNVRSAVGAALLKKRKKNKDATGSAKGKEKAAADKDKMPPPKAKPVAAATVASAA